MSKDWVMCWSGLAVVSCSKNFVLLMCATLQVFFMQCHWYINLVIVAAV